MATPSAATSYQPAQSRQGTGFTNLQQYLNANENNQLGNTISGGINNLAKSTQQGLDQSTNQFQQGLQQNSFNTPQNQGYVNNTIQNAENLQGGQNANASDVGQFQTYLGGQYQGPQGLSNASMLSGQAQNAQALGQDTTSQGGRQALLQQFAGNQNPNQQYTQGQQNLDSLLLGQQGGQLQGAARQTRGLQQNVGNAINSAQQQAQNAVAGNQQFGQKLQSNLNNAEQGYQTNLTNQANTANTAAANRLTADQQALANFQVSNNPDLAFLAGQYSYNVNPQQLQGFITPGTQATAQTIANPAQAAQYQALSQLAGQPNAFLGGYNASNAYNPANAVGVNQSAINNLLNGTAQNTQINQLNQSNTNGFQGVTYSPTSLANAQQGLGTAQQNAANAAVAQQGGGATPNNGGQSAYSAYLNQLLAALGPQFK